MVAGQPTVFDVFSRVLAGGFRESNYVKVPTGFQSFFGRPGTGSFTVFSPNANALDIEIVRANLKPAALVPRGAVGRFIGSVHQDVQINEGTMFSRRYPLIEEEVNLSADQLNYRVIASEGPYDNLTEADRLRLLGRIGYLELTRRILRLQERLAVQSITLGVQSYQNIADTTVNIYDWRRNAANIVTPTHGWGNSAGVPLTDIDSMADQLTFAGQMVPEFMLFGGLTMKYFLANTQISTNYGNKLYFNLMQVGRGAEMDPKFQFMVDAGLIYFGNLRTPKGYDLAIFTYPKMYDSSTTITKTSAKYLPDDLCVMGTTEARADRYFGPPERLPLTQVEATEIMERFGFNPGTPILPENIVGGPQVVLPQMFYTDAYASPNRKHMTLRVQGAPVFPTTQTDAWGTLTVGTTS